MERWIFALLLLASAGYLGFVARVVASFRRVNHITDRVLAQQPIDAESHSTPFGRRDSWTTDSPPAEASVNCRSLHAQ